MFKHNYIQKIAYDNIRKQKKFYKFVFISLVMVFVLSTIISILFASYEEIGYRERYERYGLWSAVVKNSNDSVIQQLEDDVDIGYIYDLGDVQYQGQKVGRMSSLDKTAQELVKLNLEDGRMPYQQDEIVLEEDQFLNLGIPQKIHQTIELSIMYQGQELTREYKIVGIVSNYTQIYDTSLGNIITSQITSNQYDALLYSQDNLNLWNEIIEKELETDILFNTNTYKYYQQSTSPLKNSYEEGDYTKILSRMIICVGFVGVLGTMVSAMAKRTENFVLMRAIGTTSKQIQKMVIYEGIILIFIALLIGLIIGVFLSSIVLYAYYQLMGGTFIFIVNKTFYIQFCLSLLTSLIGIFIPSFQAYSIPLTGKIQQKVKRNRVRKVRKINILSLGFKEFADHKMVSFLLIVIIFIGIMIGDLMNLSVESYVDTNNSIREKSDFDYILRSSQEVFSQKDLNKLTNINGLESQIIHSQKIYATWPDAAIRANILAIMSFTLNRVYTEWYRNKGYDFTITSSTAYDHKWIYGRNIFDSISLVVDEIFADYLSRPNVKQPILTQYCDGNRVSCPNWMSQWGSKNLADQGYSTIQILRNYYGDNMYINTAEEISGIPSSWPGYDLTIGSSGNKVLQMQEQLNVIAEVYSSIPTVYENGYFDEETQDAVEAFQRLFGLPVSGIVDYPTWYKIQSIYVAVTRIAELQ